MIPELISLGPVPINSFGLMVALSLLASMQLLARSFSNYGLPPEKAEQFVFVGGFTGLLGARLWYILESWNSIHGEVLQALTSSAGFTFYGGFICAFAVLFYLCRKDNISFATFLDAAGPTMTLGYAIGRLGCQLSGDGDYGMMTHSVFGMSYLTGIVPTPPGFLAFPTPLYESVICMMILPVLLHVEKLPEWGLPLRRFGLYLFCIAFERYCVEFLRINPRILIGLSEAQIISLVLCLAGAALVFSRKKVLS